MKKKKDTLDSEETLLIFQFHLEARDASQKPIDSIHIASNGLETTKLALDGPHLSLSLLRTLNEMKHHLN